MTSFLNAHDLVKDARQFIAIYPDEPKDGEEVRFDASAILQTDEMWTFVMPAPQVPMLSGIQVVNGWIPAGS